MPSCSLKVEGTKLPEGCWDLDPATTLDELLQVEAEICINPSPSPTKRNIETRDEHCPDEDKGHSEKKV